MAFAYCVAKLKLFALISATDAKPQNVMRHNIKTDQKMKFTTTICTFVLSTTTLLAQNSQINKSNEIVEKSIQAQGGKKLLENIKTLYTKSETVMDGRNVFWITKEMEPNKGSFEIEYQGRIVYKSFYDGKIGYDVVNGQKTVADQEQFKDKNYRNQIINSLDYIDTSLYTLEFIGEEKANNKDCYKIKATLSNGKVTYLYYDKTSNLLAKSEVVKNPEKNSFSTVLYDDYKKFGDLTYETKQTFVSEDGNQVAKIVDLYYNKKISEKDFK
ncbi:outer membrane lipoprotein-sorting protein [Kaistella faecalis]|nr:outer membrane lipoprotein-sorting protein [Chryseobacterium faecale]UFK97825.1 outer membrane lipoprotein-sorting protein [Chryseobacterium faecale]